MHDEEKVIRRWTESNNVLLSQYHQLRVDVVDLFNDYLCQYWKEDEDIYTISSELVLSWVERESVNWKQIQKVSPLFMKF